MVNSRNAAKRIAHEFTSGSVAMSGVAAIRPTVSALGRFINWLMASGYWRMATPSPVPLCQRFQYQFANGLERIEHTLAGHGDCLEIRRPFDPLTRRQLLDEILSGVVRV